MSRAYAQFWTLSGRSSRKEFWKWQAITTVVPLAVFAAEAAIRYRRTGSLGPLSDRFANHNSEPASEPTADAETPSGSRSDDPWGDITGEHTTSAGHSAPAAGASDPLHSAGAPLHGSDSGEFPSPGFDAFNSESSENGDNFDIEMMKAYPVTTAATLVMAVPAVASSVRRLHDVNKSGWHFAWSVVPVIGWPIFALLARGKGTDGPNRYGPATKGH